jgi:integrase
MACIRKRRGKWVVDYRDALGRRRWATCKTKAEAEMVFGEKCREGRQGTRPLVDPEITVSAYAERWLIAMAQSVKPASLSSYRRAHHRHLLPTLGTLKVRQLQKGHLRAVLTAKLAAGLHRSTVNVIYYVLRATLNAAIDDGIILTNPADRLGRQLRLARAVTARQDEIKALTREQLARFLAAAEHDRRHAVLFFLFLLLARTGMRLGEALALNLWEDVDLARRDIRVAGTLTARGRVETPKSGRGRTVDMSQQLARALARLQIERKTEALKRGWSPVPRWAFCSSTGGPLIAWHVEQAFKRVLKAAGLPLHFTPHSLRHTYASLLLQQGESPVYVQRQLGHHSITLTVDTYGRWLPMGNKAAVDRLDTASGPDGSRTVAPAGLAEAAGAEVSMIPEGSPPARAAGGRNHRCVAPPSG